MATQLTNQSILIVAVSLIGGIMGIFKSCDDALEAKAASDRTLNLARLQCVSDRETLNERWRDRLEECRDRVAK
jgi:hypothetical protein